MRVVLQRVSSASVTIDGSQYAKISKGLLVLLGVEEEDSQEEIAWLCRKIVHMRIFSDTEGFMNKSLLDVHGEVLVVSQFTLYASTKKGNRPSYLRAARPEVSVPYYRLFIETLQEHIPTKVQSGQFGADMQVTLINDGPVTIVIDTKNKE